MTHQPVLLAESIGALIIKSDSDVIDGTLGGGGHAEAVLSLNGPHGRLLGIDADPAAIVRCQDRLQRFGRRAVLVHGNFTSVTELASDHSFAGVQGILLDLGVSSFQLDEDERGFSFRSPGPLDMRMDPEQELTAEEIVNYWPQEEIADIIFRYGDEPRSRRIARAIVAARPLSSTSELANVIQKAFGGRAHEQRIHPATRTFMALRIRVNNELSALESTLPQLVPLLASGGRFAIITFHSLEDRIVKQFIARETRDCICPPNLPICTCNHHATLRPVTRKPIQPTEAEQRENPRSRSAKLRVAERL